MAPLQQFAAIFFLGFLLVLHSSSAEQTRSRESVWREYMSSTESPVTDVSDASQMADVVATVPIVNPTNGVQAPPTTTLIPTLPPPAAPVTTTTSGGSWCVASPTASSTSLQVALDYACGLGGANCAPIQPGAACFNPDTVRDHASYAFNDYYQKNPVPTSCDFSGTAVLTSVDPSSPSCQYPSSSGMSSSVPSPTTPQGGGSAGVFSPSPPDFGNSTGAAPTTSMAKASMILSLLVAFGLSIACI